MVERILIRSGKAPLDVLSHEAAFARKKTGTYSTNTGNMLFLNSVFRLLNTPSTELVSDSLTTERGGVTKRHIERINAEFDKLVLPMANSFRSQFQPGLERLATVIEQLTIPVVVVGVGAQLPPDGDWSSVDSKVHAGVKRFASAVLDRSDSIGVRGGITKDYLEWLGFGSEKVDVIGCPSMFAAGPDARVVKNLSELRRDSPLAISVNHHVPGADQVFTVNHDRFDDVVLVTQTQAEASLLVWGEELPGYPEGMPGRVTHPVYVQGDVRLFQDPSRWFEFMETRSFAFGSRLHGTIAGLHAGIPSLLLTHDSRTQELAEYHHIPHAPLPATADEVDAGHLYDMTDLGPMNSVRKQRFDHYIEFIERNDLKHIHQVGNENPSYDQAIREAPFPGPVVPLSVAPRSDLATRLNWLWQGREADQHRPHHAYKPPFTPGLGKAPVDPNSRIRKLESHAAQQSNRIEELTRELTALKKVVHARGGVINYLKLPFGTRVKMGLKTRWGRMRHR